MKCILSFPLLVSLSFSPIQAELAASQTQSSPAAQDEDLCSYLKDVDAKTNADCAQTPWVQLRSQNPAAYAQRLELAVQRKIQVLKVYESLRNSVSPVVQVPAKENTPILPVVKPPINERTFLAWVSKDDEGLKTAYIQWMSLKNAELEQEKASPASPERRKEIEQTLQANFAKMAALEKITKPKELNCFFENNCGLVSNLTSLSNVSASDKKSWTQEDFKRANEAERNQYYVRVGENRIPPSPSKLEAELRSRFGREGGQPSPCLPWAAGGALLGGYAGYLASRRRLEDKKMLVASAGLLGLAGGALVTPVYTRYAMVQSDVPDATIITMPRPKTVSLEGACPPGTIAVAMSLDPMNGIPGQTPSSDPRQIAEYEKCKQTGHAEENCSKRFLMNVGQGHGPIPQPGSSGRRSSMQVNCVPRSNADGKKAGVEKLGADVNKQETDGEQDNSGPAIGIVENDQRRGILISPLQLQRKFKHANYFGIEGNYNSENAVKFKTAIQEHVSNPETTVIQGTYRGNSVTHFVNSKTGVDVMRSPGGEFISGWKLSPIQLEYVLQTGNLW